MQQLPVLSAAPLAPARPGQDTVPGSRGSGARQDVIDLRHSQRLTRRADPTIRERWSRANAASERTYGRTGGTPASVIASSPASRALQTVAPAFVAQLIGQVPDAQTGVTGRGRALTAALASSAYRQAGAEPAPTSITARHLDIAV